MKDLFAESITTLPLGERARTCLRNAGVTYVGALVQLSEAQLLVLRNLGQVTMKEIRVCLAERGLRLGMTAREIEDVVEIDDARRSVGCGDALIEEDEREAVDERKWNDGLEALDLTDREWRVLEGRFGVGRRLKLRELGRQIGVTHERVRQIESVALMTLARSLEMVGRDLQQLERWLREEPDGRAEDATVLGARLRRTMESNSATDVTERDVRRVVVVVRALGALGVGAADWPDLSLSMCLLNPPIRELPGVVDTLARRASAEREKKRQWGYRELAMVVLRQERLPMHWRDIADRADAMARRRSFSASSLFNELGRHPQVFVRVSQGTYGLAEWGLEPSPTINDLIANILAGRGKCMGYGEVLRLVRASQQVKPLSVQMTLNLHPRFYRSLNGSYGLRAWLPDRRSQTLRTPKDLVETTESRARVAKAVRKGYDVERLVAGDSNRRTTDAALDA